MAAIARYRLGFIVPSMNFIVEPDVQRLAPADVSTHVSRVLVTEKSLEHTDPAAGYPRIFGQSNAGLELAAHQLATADVQSICYAVTGGSFYGGRAWDEQFRTGIQEKWSIPATSTSYAIVEALRAVDVKRLSVATAYVREQDVRLATFLEEHGFEILAIDGLRNTRVQQPASEGGDRVRDLVRRVLRPEADGVLISCAGLAILDLIEPLEEKLSLPVVASNQAALWSSLRAAAYDGEPKGVGSLFRVYSPLLTDGLPI